MAHPKLATVVNRSLLTVTAAALTVGPLAGAAFAQDGSLVDPVLDLTCKEAKATEDLALIKEFCPEAEAEATESPLDKSVDEVTGTVDKTVTDTTKTVAPAEDTTDGGGGGEDGEPDPGTVLSPSKEKPTSSDVGTTGDGGFTPVEEGANDGGRSQGERANPAAPGEFAYNTDGPVLPGMRSNSSLTLQPFAAPLVSVPPIYELPQIASQLFGGDSAATAEDPLVAGAATATGASAYSPTGYSATSADPTGWLAATATGLIMLVGAAHAINGGRLPKRSRSEA